MATITLHNYETFLIDHLHGELAAEHLVEMEHFLHEHPAIAEEFEMLQQTVVVPDTTIVFEPKEQLRKSTPSLIVRLKPYYRAAAIVIGVLCCIYFLLRKDSPSEPLASQTKTSLPTPSTVNNTQKIEPQQTPEKIQPSPTLIKPLAPSQSTNNSILVKKSKQLIPTKTNATMHISDLEKQIIEPEQQQVIVKEISNKKDEPTLLPLPQNNIQEEVQDAATLANNIPTTKQTFELNSRKQPKLFKAIAQLTRLSRKVKHTKEQLTEHEYTVMIGNTKLFHLNNN
jgi:hypothetical protein